MIKKSVAKCYVRTSQAIALALLLPFQSFAEDQVCDLGCDAAANYDAGCDFGCDSYAPGCDSQCHALTMREHLAESGITFANNFTQFYFGTVGGGVEETDR